MPEPNRALIENKYAAAAAVVGFLLAVWLSDGSLMAGFGAFALIAGIAWAIHRMLRPASNRRD